MRHSAMLELNASLVLDFVRTSGSATRGEIAQALDLSPASVSRIVRRLADRQLLVVEAGEAPVEGHIGRPRGVVAYNNQAGWVLGVDLGGTKCHGVLTDLSGSVVDEEVRPTRQDGAPYPTLLAVIRALLDRASANDRMVSALAVAVPAIVDPDRGVALGGPNVSWDGFPIYAELASATSVPFVVENDANLAALAHAWRGSGRGCANFVTISVGTGIGAAVVADGRLLKGHRSAAGEVGFMVLEPTQLDDERPRNLGGLERLASGPAIVEQYVAARGATGDGTPVTTEDVFALAAGGEGAAAEVIERVVDRLAMAIIAIAAVANPELVVLEGSVGHALAAHVDRIAASVARHLPTPPRIELGTLGQQATVLGAVAAAMQLTREELAPDRIFDTFVVRDTQPRRGLRVDVV